MDLLITDARLALTLLELAETTKVEEDHRRRIGEATHAYETIVHFLARVTPTKEQLEELNGELTTLRERLSLVGVHV
ncbi:hypothetical protein DYQ86_07710 [Acidobacteria bacterium AB60]|nr:hypothetical protein DYQ86_07710 [Acidobacteria bacterium AB60]